MTDAHYTALLLLVDRSGSMDSIRDDMLGGLRALLEEQRKLPGFITVDLVQFDDTIDTVYQMVDPENITISLEPRGRTALHDAIGLGVNGFSQRIDALPDHAQPKAIQVVVVTDGLENASNEYTAKQVKELVTAKQEDPRWDFMFLGANQDAVLSGENLGFQRDSSMTFAAQGAPVRNVSQAASRYISDRRSGTRRGFTTDERRQASGE